MKCNKLFYSGNTAVFQLEGHSIYCFHAGMAIDADGCPEAYHPENTGLDDLKHGGYTGNWWGIATDNELPGGNPLIQTSEDPAPGYYVSTTSLIDARFQYRDTRRYIDARRIPYYVLPDNFSEQIELGDIAWVYNSANGLGHFAVFADVGPAVGESSMHLAEELGVDNDPRYGGVDSGIFYFIFCRSGKGNGAAITVDEIILTGNQFLDGLLITDLIRLADHLLK